MVEIKIAIICLIKKHDRYLRKLELIKSKKSFDKQKK